ncbi:unnamed protein product [Spirodela intermedia]|uniref:Uncharacterized protein n=1 Tax=Spirodela intermedia TaxID=51605 RepID=A0A7I8JIX5_SPIIN|nr:unnamed protein product [Spirodela intermedia]CAA6670089.1 unnamed protein product [Spirodela intermedia]
MFSTAVKIPYTLNVPAPAAAAATEDHLPLLRRCSDLREARQVHALILKSGQTLYANGDSPLCAERLLLSLRLPPAVATFTCNSAMRALLLNQDPLRSLLLLILLHHNQPSFEPDSFTFTIALKAAARLPSPILRRGLHSTVHLRNKLLHLYCVAGDFAAARKLFDETPQKDPVACNTMLRGLAGAGDGASLRRLFQEIPCKDVVSWNTMISFLVAAGDHAAALETFRELQLAGGGVIPDRVTLIGVLSAVAHLGALPQGQWVHCYILRRRMELDDHLLSALITMYAKSGCLEAASATFEAAAAPSRGADVWNAMLAGLVAGGRAAAALQLFSRMEATGGARVQPRGLLRHGAAVFEKMAAVYGVEPDLGHYGCMVDMYCRAGELQRAEEIIGEMPMEPDATVWKTVVGACLRRRRRRTGRASLEVGERAGRRLLELAREDDHAAYVLVSNLYAAAGRWQDVAGIRCEMRKRKVKKVPGCSSIVIDGAVHEFIAGD